MLFYDSIQGFEDRHQAGQSLAAALESYNNKPGTILLALPRGGVPVAGEVAEALSLPMDIWLVRKLPIPDNKELAMGAVTLNGSSYINGDIVQKLNVPASMIAEAITRETNELRRQNDFYREGKPLPDLRNKTVIIIDDGAATGTTMRAAIKSVRRNHPGRVIAAIPVGSREACKTLRKVADQVICLLEPVPFGSVGQWYENFFQVSDRKVQQILSAHSGNHNQRPGNFISM